MLAIGGIGTSTVMPRTAHREEAAPRETGEAATQARALVPIAAPTPSQRSTTALRRPLAAFLAHLIATQAQAPQTRARRRAEPDDVHGIYVAATKRRPATRSKLDRHA